MKTIALGTLVGAAVLGVSVVTVFAAGGGFNSYGYNWTANIFNGPLSGWCAYKGISLDQCGQYGFGSPYDQLVMKWNAEWNRGNKENWSNPPYNAWVDNEFNGNVPGGDGYVWHYKIVWVGSCGADGTPLPNGGYCIWQQFEVLMDQGITPGSGHSFNALTTPDGYGAYYSH